MADRSKLLKARRNADYAARFKRKSRKQRRALRRQQTARREQRWLEQNGLVMPVMSICPAPGCGVLTEGGRCPTHKSHGSPRRHAKQREQGSNDNARWRALKQRVRERDGNACVDCGSTEDLTCDLVNEALNGDHRLATEDDCLTRCRTCHGRRHGLEQPRRRRRRGDGFRRGGGSRVGSEVARPAPSSTRETSTTPPA